MAKVANAMTTYQATTNREDLAIASTTSIRSTRPACR
jgi:hypothetical protein